MSRKRRDGGSDISLQFSLQIGRPAFEAPPELADWPLDKFREYVSIRGRSAGLAPFVAATGEVMRARPSYAAGPLPPTLRQRQGEDLQAYAVVNGLRAWQMFSTGRAINPTLADLAGLRAEAGHPDAKGPLAARAVANVLVNSGVLQSADADVGNPVAAASRMTRNFGFAVVTSAVRRRREAGNAVAIVPNVRSVYDSAGQIPPFIMLDSLNELEPQAVGTTKFCKMFYDHAGGGPEGRVRDNQFLLCELDPAALDLPQQQA